MTLILFPVRVRLLSKKILVMASEILTLTDAPRENKNYEAGWRQKLLYIHND